MTNLFNAPNATPLGLLLGIFGILAALCAVIFGIRWVVAHWPKRKQRTYRKVSRADLDRQGR